MSRRRGFVELHDSVDIGNDPVLRLYSGGKVIQFLNRTVKDLLAASNGFDNMRARLSIKMIGNGHLFIAAFRIRQHLRWYAHSPYR